MKLNRVFTKRIDHDSEGLSVRAAIQGAIALNVDERGGHASASSEQDVAPHAGPEKTHDKEERDE